MKTKWLHLLINYEMDQTFMQVSLMFYDASEYNQNIVWKKVITVMLLKKY
jgi:hypothetical protein